MGRKIDKVSFDPAKADRIFTILNERLFFREEEIFFEGRLTGVNVRTSSFELCFSEGIKITGRIIKDLVPKAVSTLDKRCKADLVKVITESSAGKEKVTWVLNDVNFVEERIQIIFLSSNFIKNLLAIPLQCLISRLQHPSLQMCTFDHPNAFTKKTELR